MGPKLELDEVEIAVYPTDVTFFFSSQMVYGQVWIPVKEFSISNCVRKVFCVRDPLNLPGCEGWVNDLALFF